jgi:hypothetical protein
MRALGELGVHLSTDAVMHTPVEVTERVMEKLAECDADCILALGGGSTIGLGKALALRTDLPQIVLPTTYAGSEATPVLGETRQEFILLSDILGISMLVDAINLRWRTWDQRIDGPRPILCWTAARACRRREHSSTRRGE